MHYYFVRESRKRNSLKGRATCTRNITTWQTTGVAVTVFVSTLGQVTWSPVSTSQTGPGYICSPLTPWLKSESELNRPSDRRLSAKLVPTFHCPIPFTYSATYIIPIRPGSILGAQTCSGAHEAFYHMCSGDFHRGKEIAA
jgi:hypothetical protein